MASFGLNAIRIPVGYWMLESLVYSDSEHFPQGGFAYLERLCGWASDAGFFIMIDLHGAPGAQVASNSDTGQNAPTAGFYESWQYNRGTAFMSWLTTQIHTNSNFRNVGMVGVVNEPIQSVDAVGDMMSYYYNNAYTVCPSLPLLNIHNRIYICCNRPRTNDPRPSAPPKPPSKSPATTTYTSNS